MKWFALVDCNSFYASCEQVFAPAIHNSPVIVLSNNDGCVIARSRQAKEIGIKMGVPYWEIKSLIEQKGVKVFSSNYPLYGSMSNRVMNILHQCAPEVEVYSIDEAFLRLDFKENAWQEVYDYGQNVRQKILQWVHLPTCVGMGKTKTLSKLANHIAKNNTSEGVCVLEADDPILTHIPVTAIWGIAAGYERRLAKAGIRTAAELQQASETWMYREFGVVGLRLLKELQGTPCYALDPPVSSRQNILVSRSFRRDVYQQDELLEAISVYATRLAEKLRQYQQVADYITVFLMANPFKNVRKDRKQYFSQGATLPFATSNTNELITFSAQLIKSLYEAGTNYKKAGILASGLRPETVLQTHLFLDHEHVLRNKKIMQAMDQINRKEGRNTVFFASCGTQRNWSRKEQWRSPRYTTRWEELLRI
ncbi:MAG TPA: Y-family DNA polymerase [Saprospiraceae bacterium]|nr:Y-family DNA polymerase [Saprospiraceae bacterium]HMQ84086.1 Y-family DNA polymerase [Saprospiraceae bacterium]